MTSRRTKRPISYRRLLASVSEAVLVLDSRYAIRYANAAAGEIAGVSPAEMLGRSPLDFIAPEDAAHVTARLRERLEEDAAPSRLDARVVQPDGTQRRIEFLAGTLDETSRGRLLVVTGRDVTAQREAEQHLAESQQRLVSLIEHTPQVVYDYDVEGNLTYCNGAAEAMMGIPCDELIGKALVEVVHPDDQAEAVAAFQGALAGEARWYQVRVIRPGRPPAHLRGVKVPLRVGDRIVGVTGMGEDVTEAVNSREELAAAERRLHHILSAHPTIVYSLRVRNGVREPSWMSDSIRDILGFDPADAMRVGWWMRRVHPDDLALVQSTFDSIGHRETRMIEYRMRRADREYVWLQDVVRSVDAEDGDGTELIGSATDITSRKTLEHQLVESQKMEAVGRLTGGVAHDFNNLLTAIQGYTQLLLEEREPDAADRADLEEIAKAAEQAGRLTQQLLAFSRRQLLTPARLDVNDVVRDLESMLRRLLDARITFEIDLDPALPHVHADRTRLEQVILNLCLNAQDAMTEGGTLRVATRPGRPREMAGSVCITITDTGSGIPLEARDHVFEPFFTTKPPGHGTGLGLSTVYGIVQQSGGEIEFETEAGEGTTFRVFLPVAGSTD